MGKHQLARRAVQLLGWLSLTMTVTDSLHASNNVWVGVYDYTDAQGNPVYLIVDSYYISGVEYEPTLPNDGYGYPLTPIGGPICDEWGNCTQPQGVEKPIRSSREDDWTGERISAHLPIGVYWASSIMTFIPRLLGQGGGSPNPHEPPLRARPDPEDNECDSGETSFDAAEEAIEALWDDTNFSPFRRARQRSNYDALETSGFILPNGQFIDLGAIGGLQNVTACSFNFVHNVVSNLTIPPGSIWVHAHPWQNGDDQLDECGPSAPGATRRTYRNGPGSGDAGAFNDLLTHFPGLEAVIIDGDGIYFMDENGNVISEADRCF